MHYGALAADEKRLTAESMQELSRGTKELIVSTLLKLHPPKHVVADIQAVDKATAFRLLDGLFVASTQCFAKAFTDGMEIARAGGATEAVCPHGNVCAILPIARTESTLDAVKVLTTFKHLPNVAFFDFWCGGTAQLLAECSAVDVHLGPRSGALYLADAKEKPVVSVPALAVEECPSFSHTDSVIASPAGLGVQRQPHPVSGSDLLFAAHDRFHGASHVNKPTKRCDARDPDLIAETRTMNSMRHEEANILREKDSSWLRNYTPQRNLFMLRVISHLRNRERALDFLQLAHKREAEQQRQDPAAGWELRLNSFGQIKLFSAHGGVVDL